MHQQHQSKPPSQDAPPPSTNSPRSGNTNGNASRGTPSGIAMGLGMGFEFSGAVIGMAALGYGVDYLTGGGTTWTFVGAIVGLLGGFYNLINASKRMNARNARAQRTPSNPTPRGRSKADPVNPISRAQPWAGRKAAKPTRVDLFASQEIDADDVHIDFPPGEHPGDEALFDPGTEHPRP